MTDFSASDSSLNHDIVDVAPPDALPLATTANLGCLSELQWLASAWALACFSLAFYRHAVRRPMRAAILLLFIFGLISAVLQTVLVTRSLLQTGQEMQAELERRDFPEIRISGGVAEVEGAQPLILVDEGGILVAIDTTGALDPNILRDSNGEYQQGFLLTSNKLAILNRNGRYQETRLGQLQPLLGDPFILNQETVQTYWAYLSFFIAGMVAIALSLWNTLLRLFYLLLIAGLFYGILQLTKRRHISFGQVLTVGLYVVFPTLLVRLLLAQVGVDFWGLFTLILIPAWVGGLWVAFSKSPVSPIFDKFGLQRRLWAWRAWFALPLAVNIALEMMFQWQAWYVTWPLAAVTLAGLAIVSLRPNRQIASAEFTPISAPPAQPSAANKRKTLFWILTAAVLVSGSGLCVCLVGLYTTGLGTTLQDMVLANYTVAPGYNAPEFSLPTTSGETIALNQLRGSPIVIIFGATWCIDCQREAPTLVELQQNHQNLKIVYINIKESPTLVQEFIDQYDLNFPVLLDQEGAVAKQYHVYAIPAVFFVDQQGVIQERMYETLSETQVKTALSAIGLTP